jgi:hypothetical protein
MHAKADGDVHAERYEAGLLKATTREYVNIRAAYGKGDMT